MSFSDCYPELVDRITQEEIDILEYGFDNGYSVQALRILNRLANVILEEDGYFKECRRCAYSDALTPRKGYKPVNDRSFSLQSDSQCQYEDIDYYDGFTDDIRPMISFSQDLEDLIGTKAFEIICSKVIDGESFLSLSKRLGISERTVRRYYHNGISKAKECLHLEDYF